MKRDKTLPLFISLHTSKPNDAHQDKKMKRLLLGLFLFSGVALGAECDKIEYAEAKDWTPAELHIQACTVLREMANNSILFGKASEHGGVLDPVALMYSNQSTACMKQYELYVRILKNIHHIEKQSCGDVPRK